MAKRQRLLRLPELRRGLQPLEGQVRGLRRLEHASSRRPAPRSRMAGPGRDAPGPRQGPRRSRSRASPARRTEAPRMPSGIAELDRVTGGGFVRGSVILHRRRSRHRQVDAADAGLRRARQPRRTASSTSRARRRSRRCGCAPSASASADAPVELAAETNVEDILATLSPGPAAGARRHRLDPDHVDRDGRIGARHGDARCAAARRR